MQTIGGREPLHGDLGRFYDAIENPRRTRGELPILRDAELRAYLADVRERTLDVLDGVRRLGADAEDPLLRDGFVYEMLLAHELQHNETMLQLLQMVDGYEPCGSTSVRSPEPRPRGARDARRRRRRVRDRRPAGRLRLRQRARPPHGRARRLRDRPHPGQQRRLRRASSRRPGPSRRCTGARRRPRSTASAARSSTSPGTSADAFARWAGKRLPSEQEWEAASAAAGRRRARPGNGPPPTSSPIPGFEAFPYPEYSQVFFGDAYRVLRGGSWATHPSVMRPSFRNWDLPQRRQIFSGIRCARDA